MRQNQVNRINIFITNVLSSPNTGTVKRNYPTPVVPVDYGSIQLPRYDRHHKAVLQCKALIQGFKSEVNEFRFWSSYCNMVFEVFSIRWLDGNARRIAVSSYQIYADCKLNMLLTCQLVSLGISPEHHLHHEILLQCSHSLYHRVTLYSHTPQWVAQWLNADITTIHNLAFIQNLAMRLKGEFTV